MKKLKYSVIRSGTEILETDDLLAAEKYALSTHVLRAERVQVIRNYGSKVLLDLPFKSKKK